MSEQQPTAINLDIPLKEGKEGYIGLVFNMYSKMGAILQSPEFSREPMRIYYMGLLIISLIPDEKERDQVRADFNTKINELTKAKLEKKGGSALTEHENAHLIIEAVMLTMGDVISFIDRFLGISKDNRICVIS